MRDWKTRKMVGSWICTIFCITNWMTISPTAILSTPNFSWNPIATQETLLLTSTCFVLPWSATGHQFCDCQKQRLTSAIVLPRKTMNGSLHPKAKVNRLYMERGYVGTWLIRVRVWSHTENVAWQNIWYITKRNCYRMLLVQKDWTKLDLKVIGNSEIE